MIKTLIDASHVAEHYLQFVIYIKNKLTLMKAHNIMGVAKNRKALNINCIGSQSSNS
jgi:hypothetical protein